MKSRPLEYVEFNALLWIAKGGFTLTAKSGNKRLQRYLDDVGEQIVAEAKSELDKRRGRGDV